MKYVEAPETIPPSILRSLFVAGGITGTVDWQKPFIEKLDPLNILVLNPRRKNFDVNKSGESEAQIEWEYNALSVASAVSFWFPPETLCPITLFELGTLMKNSRTIFVGCHPDYGRKFDVITQVALYRPEIKVVDQIDDLVEQVVEWALSD